MPIPQMMYVDGLAKIDINCPDCLKSYDGVIIGRIGAPKECECGCEFDLEGLFARLSYRKPKYCENCEYWADNEVCTNANSENVADFTARNFQCNFHKFKEIEVTTERKTEVCPICGREADLHIENLKDLTDCIVSCKNCCTKHHFETQEQAMRYLRKIK